MWMVIHFDGGDSEVQGARGSVPVLAPRHDVLHSLL